MRTILSRYLPGLALVAALALGCKQGEGEVCQIDDDCEDGLECNAGTSRCQKPGSSFFDAAPIYDSGPMPDAPPVPDAAVDAGPDAGVDAGIDAGGT